MCIVPIGNGQMNRKLMLFGLQEKVNVDLKLKGNYACYDIYGNKESLIRQDIEVSPSILYFVGE